MPSTDAAAAAAAGSQTGTPTLAASKSIITKHVRLEKVHLVNNFDQKNLFWQLKIFVQKNFPILNLKKIFDTQGMTVNLGHWFAIIFD